MPDSNAVDLKLHGTMPLVDAARLYAAGAALVCSTAVFAFFRYTMTGKAIRACADNYMGARVVGLDIRHLYALTFGLGAACVAAAGCMMVLLVDVTPLLGPAYTLMAFVIVIVGTFASIMLQTPGPTFSRAWRIVRIEVNRRESWQLGLNDGLVLILGREQMAERLERFTRFYPQALALAPTGHGPTAFKRVDLRYPNGFAVRVATS